MSVKNERREAEFKARKAAREAMSANNRRVADQAPDAKITTEAPDGKVSRATMYEVYKITPAIYESLELWALLGCPSDYTIRIRDDKGRPMSDADGNPLIAPDVKGWKREVSTYLKGVVSGAIPPTRMPDGKIRFCAPMPMNSGTLDSAIDLANLELTILAAAQVNTANTKRDESGAVILSDGFLDVVGLMLVKPINADVARNAAPIVRLRLRAEDTAQDERAYRGLPGYDKKLSARDKAAQKLADAESALSRAWAARHPITTSDETPVVAAPLAIVKAPVKAAKPNQAPVQTTEDVIA